MIAEKLKAIVGERVRSACTSRSRTIRRCAWAVPRSFGSSPHRKDFRGLIRLCRENISRSSSSAEARIYSSAMAAFGGWSFIPGAASSNIEVDGCEITAGAGVKLKEVAYAAWAARLGGLEWMECIPGKVGGALRMNAGAMGDKTFDNVTRVRYLDAEGNST